MMHGLMIEDERVVTELVIVVLGDKFEIDVAESIQEAMAKYLKNCYDFMILDLNLPNGKGTSTIDRVHELFPDVPIVVFSGHDYPKRDIIERGAKVFVSKSDFAMDKSVLENGIYEAVATGEIIESSRRMDKRLECVDKSLKKAEMVISEMSPPPKKSPENPGGPPSGDCGPSPSP